VTGSSSRAICAERTARLQQFTNAGIDAYADASNMGRYVQIVTNGYQSFVPIDMSSQQSGDHLPPAMNNIPFIP
jgi:hypothetical protein